MQEDKLPEELSPVNLKAYFYNNFGACGCSDLSSMIDAVLKLLRWHEMSPRTHWEDLYKEPGVFYLLAGLLDSLGLAEHGGSIRHPWLTADGARLLSALNTTDSGVIEDAGGLAYDGLQYLEG